MEDSEVAEQIHLSVILPVRNGEPFLAGQLEALAMQECSFAWELIVVDNGSTDTSVDTARGFSSRFEHLRILSEPRAGRSNALNTGRKVASGEFIVVVDADDEVDAGYLEAMAEGLEQYDMVSSVMDTNLFNPWVQGNAPPDDWLAPYLNFLPAVDGCRTGIRASAWQRIGDYATDVGLQEDIDFSWRAQLLGMTVGMAPGAVLHWRRPTRAWENFRKGRGYGRGQVRLYKRYRSRGLPRRKIVVELAHIKQVLLEILHREDHWQWRMAWHLGLVEGRLEESLRQRVFFP